MTFKTQMQADVDSVFFNTDEFAFSGVYYQRGTGIESDGVFIFEPMTDPGFISPGQALTARIHGATDSIPHPQVNDEIIISGGQWDGTWRIDSLVGGDEYCWIVQASTTPRVQP